MSFMFKHIAAMNLAFWSEIGSRLNPLQLRRRGEADLASAARLHWVDEQTVLGDPMLDRLACYWRQARQGRALPPVSAIDPFALRFALGHMVVVEPSRDSVEFPVRLYGSKLAYRNGYDLTGKMLRDIPDVETRRATEQAAARVLFGMQPLQMQRHRLLEGEIVDYAALLLPFGDSTPSRIIIALSYPDRHAGAAFASERL